MSNRRIKKGGRGDAAVRIIAMASEDEGPVLELEGGPAGAEPGRRSPLARDPARVQRRYPPEDKGRRFAWRSPFERDRDRVIHARAFRRLGEKSQLLPATLGLQVRNRLTHTLEVTSAARNLARHLGLNEDLTEVIALAHDLGQPPFGAAGGRALDTFLRAAAAPGAPPDGEGFDPRAQTLRVVDFLEIRYEHPGLNLTDDVREGLFKLAGEGTAPPTGIDPFGLRVGEPGPLEGQAVAAAITAITPLHDLEDALGQGMLEVSDLERLPPVKRLIERLAAAGGWPRGRFRQHAGLHRSLVHTSISDILIASRRRLSRAEEVGAIPPGKPVIAPSAKGAGLAEALRELVAARVIGRQAVRRADSRAARIVGELAEAFHEDPRLVDDAVLLRYKELTHRPFLRDLPRAGQERAIAEHFHGQPAFLRLLADHIAGMTDRFAQETWQALVPGRSVP